MKIILDDYSKSEPIIIEQFLEPTFAGYTMKQGDNEIKFASGYQIKEIADIFKFLTKDDY